MFCCMQGMVAAAFQSPEGRRAHALLRMCQRYGDMHLRAIELEAVADRGRRPARGRAYHGRLVGGAMTTNCSATGRPRGAGLPSCPEFESQIEVERTEAFRRPATATVSDTIDYFFRTP